MNIEQYTVAGFALIGIINGFQFLLNKEYKSFIKFMIAVVIGSLFGFLGWFELADLQTGLMVGLASSGVYKVAQTISK